MLDDLLGLIYAEGTGNGEKMPLINITNLTFGYDYNLFENANFQIDTDWKLGFVGRNGRGKTTFLNILLKKLEYSGTISSSVDFDYFPFRIEDENKTIVEIVGDNWQAYKEISLLSIEDDVLERPFNTLSNGEKTKIKLALLFSKEEKFLLIDEPTNHLDIQGRELLSTYLKSKKGFILVSHDRSFLDGCVDHILSINKSSIDVVKGNFSTWYYNKNATDNFESAQNEKLKKDIKRLSESARQKSLWSDKIEKSKIGQGPVDKGYIGHKAAKMMQRSKNIERNVNRSKSEKERLLQNIDRADELKMHPLNFHSERLVECNNLSICYGESVVFSDISFVVNQGDRIAVSGKNGSGKSSILKLLCDENIQYTGTLYKANNLNIAYVSQDTSHLKGSIALFEEEKKLDATLFRTNLHKLGFEKSHFDKNIETFSEGQKKKVLIAQSLSVEAHLYIWDEPLNYIDVLSRIQIEDLLLAYEPTIIFVEHDKLFCDTISTKTVKLI